MRACVSPGVLIVGLIPVLLLPVQVFAGEPESVLCEETSALPARRRRPLPPPTVPYIEPRTTFPSGLLPGEPVVSETVQPRPLRRVQEGTCDLVVRRHADGHYTLTQAGFELRIDPDGHLTVRDRITADLTDLVMRAAGQDPYAASKEKALRATFPLRLALAERYRRGQLQLALGELPRRLEQLWADAARGPAARRRLLFELWDECLEGSAGGGSGELARATILVFVRRHMPPGSPDSFPLHELAALNAGRQSRALFAP
jgi:hypothetical protein